MKKTTTTGIARGLIASSAIFILGCDALVDFAIDCIDRDGPEFNKTLLISPVLNQVYDETIIASIDNEPQDDRFDYEFGISGSLPRGIAIEEVGRRLIFSGTATETGEFPIQVSVEVSHRNGNLDSGLCFTTETQSYLLTVLPM